MTRSQVKTYKYRAGKNTFIIINIFQSATAAAANGNVIASNAANVQIWRKPRQR
ncbi:hypothetical protein ACHHV8_24910 [Paenibacillus sp. TAB 01]|uniref:hypothetical protein n=1 Tax=Paenibacillus sp. TAB 01 TaxID=3368988 RepID=UPI003750DF79